ncbi:unnamed protein product [Diplocarpon coronariae]|nr:hypothetical protein JHW43_000498 [Diplocarpon mali]
MVSRRDRSAARSYAFAERASGPLLDVLDLQLGSCRHGASVPLRQNHYAPLYPEPVWSCRTSEHAYEVGGALSESASSEVGLVMSLHAQAECRWAIYLSSRQHRVLAAHSTLRSETRCRAVSSSQIPPWRLPARASSELPVAHSRWSRHPINGRMDGVFDARKPHRQQHGAGDEVGSLRVPGQLCLENGARSLSTNHTTQLGWGDRRASLKAL